MVDFRPKRIRVSVQVQALKELLKEFQTFLSYFREGNNNKCPEKDLESLDKNI